MRRPSRSQRNGEQIIDGDFIYEIKRRQRNTITWRCISRVCPVVAKTPIHYLDNLDDFVVFGNHTDHNDSEKICKKGYLEAMKSKIISCTDSPRNIVYSCIRGVDVDTIKALGNFDALFRLLRDYRLKTINPLPYYNSDLNLSLNLNMTHLGEEFLRYGPGIYDDLEVNDNILMFFSDIMLEKLKLNSVLAIDGTFSVVPYPYYQLYTISYIKDGHVFPVVFAILKNKTFETYDALFRILKTFLGDYVPSVVKTDYEKAAIKAFEVNFPTARISGCYFHLGQAIQRKVTESGLSVQYRTYNNIKRFAKALLSLAFVKYELVVESYNLLREHPHFPPQLTGLYNYFYLNYCRENAPYPPKYWHTRNILDINIPKTNNAIEGWHNTFSKTFGPSKFSFPILVYRLKNEEDVVRIRSIQMDELNHVFERKKLYVDQEAALLRYLTSCRGMEFGFDFMMGVTDKVYY